MGCARSDAFRDSRNAKTETELGVDPGAVRDNGEEQKAEGEVDV